MPDPIAPVSPNAIPTDLTLTELQTGSVPTPSFATSNVTGMPPGVILPQMNAASGDTNDPNAKKQPGADQSDGMLFDTDPPPWELQNVPKVNLAIVVFSETPHGPYDYRIPDSMLEHLEPGMRIRVPLARRRQPQIGWCTAIQTNVPASRTLKDVDEIVDEEPLCDENMVQLVLWIAHYYQSPPGAVFEALIPSAVRSAAGTREKTFY
ncbi:MAG: hypothetical protein AAFN70_07935, partial [Planctomycetota bacterium]